MIRSSATQYSIPLGVLVTREDDAWLANRWRAVGVFLDPPGTPSARSTRGAPYHAATMPLHLDCRKSMEYKVNLANGEPSIYVVMAEDARRPTGPQVQIRLVSASPFEVQPYRDDHGTVDRVPMPPQLIELVRSLLDH